MSARSSSTRGLSNIMWAMLMLLFRCALCTPPEDPIKCAANNQTCTITNSYGAFPDRSTCRVADVAYPTSEKDVISIVAVGAMAGRKMKVATRFSHSIPKLVCPDGENGLVISTKYLNRVVKVDVESLSITVESGVTLRQVIEEAGRVGLALPYAPYWWGLTVGGLMATGAHGSTLWGTRGSSVHDYADEIRIVTPTAAGALVRVVRSGEPNLDAVKVSLGVLGVITQVTLKLETLFKRSIRYVTRSDTQLGDEATSFGNKHEFGDILWYPSQRKAVYRVDNRVPLNTSGNGLFDFIPFRSTLSIVTGLIRITEENQESMDDSIGKCAIASFTTSTLITAAFGLTNDGVIFRGYPVIGYHNRLQSSGTCLDSLQDGHITSCPWDSTINGEFFHQTTFSIALSKASAFIQDVQKLVAIEPRSLCVVEQYNGILMRYVQASTAYLGKQEDAIDFDITYYRSKDPLAPRLFQDFLEEIEQMAVFKYGALPHWGKNRNVAFKGAIGKYSGAAQFLKVKEEYDPLGLFSNEWTDQLLGLRDGLLIVVRDGCALEGLCICSKDAHCAPSKGYYCRPGKVYAEARVCTRLVGFPYALKL